MIHQSLWTNRAIFCNIFVQDIELLSWLYNKRSNFKHYSKSCCILVSLNTIPRPAQHKFCGTYTHFKFTVISYQSQPTIQIWLSQSGFLDLQHHSYIHIRIVLSKLYNRSNLNIVMSWLVAYLYLQIKYQELHNTNLVGDV